jgi:hypothetical protein
MALAATAFAVAGALAPLTASAQQPKGQPPAQEQQQDQSLAPPKPYKPLAIKLPAPMRDAGFEAFRKQLGGIAEKKDRAGLARLVVARNFFWIPADKDVADRRKSGIDNLAKAIGLDGSDAPGWELLGDISGEASAEPFPDRQGVVCSPAQASFDEKAAEELAKATQTDPSEWAYPARDGVEVRADAAKTSAVIEKLGLYLVRVYPDDSPASAVQGDVLRIVTPSGKLGFVATEQLRPLASDQVCYVKEGNAWKIAGIVGGSGEEGQ